MIMKKNNFDCLNDFRDFENESLILELFELSEMPFNGI